jgi:hypothetical protein
MREGADGLLREKTRLPDKKRLDAEVIEQVVGLTAEDPLAEPTHWTAGIPIVSSPPSSAGSKR